MSTLLRYALIGCGNIGIRHAQQMARTGTLVAVCDIVIEKATALATTHNAKAYQSLQQMLETERIDIVAVCTPNGLHAQHSIAAIKAGCHVLCEKPLAISTQSASEMIDAAEIHQKKLLVVKQNRYNPPVLAVKKLLLEKKLGNILSFQINCFWNRPETYYKNSWKGTKDLDGGTLYTQFSHFIDLLYWFLGDIDDITAITANLLHKNIIEFEDIGLVNIKMKNSTIGNIHYTVNSFNNNMEGSFTIFGEKGTVKIGGQYLNELSYQCIDNITINNLSEGSGPNAYGNYTGSMSNHNKVYDDLVKDILLNETNLPSAKEGLASVDIIERIYSSANFIQ